MRVVAAQYYRSATATRSGSPYTGPCRSLIPFVRHGVLVAFLLRDVSHKASSGNNLTAGTREVARLIVALRSPNRGWSEPASRSPNSGRKIPRDANLADYCRKPVH